MKKINMLKKEIIRLIKANYSEWNKVIFIIHFPPYTNKGFSGSQSFWDVNGNELNDVKVFFLDNEASEIFFDFWYETKDKYNEIIFTTKKDDYENATIEARFNQEVEDNFQNNLPKSKRGKTIPWWNNDKYKRG